MVYSKLHFRSCSLIWILAITNSQEFHEGMLCGGGEEVRVTKTQGFQECELYCLQDARRYGRTYQAIAYEYHHMSNFADCMCWTHCDCWSEHDRYEMYLEAGNVWPTKRCSSPIKYAYPSVACQHADSLYLKELGVPKAFMKYECDKYKRQVITHVYADRHQCHLDENKLKTEVYPWNLCFEDYPNEWIKVDNCYDGGINFTRCDIEELKPSSSPTITYDCDTCVQSFVDRGGCPGMVLNRDNGGLISPECSSCEFPIFRWCIDHTTVKPTSAPVPTKEPSLRPSRVKIITHFVTVKPMNPGGPMSNFGGSPPWSPQTTVTIAPRSDGNSEKENSSSSGIPDWVWLVLIILVILLICCLIVAVFVFRKKDDDKHERLMMDNSATRRNDETNTEGKYLHLTFPYPDVHVRDLHRVQRQIMQAYRKALNKFFKDASKPLRSEAQRAEINLNLVPEGSGSKIKAVFVYKTKQFKQFIQEEEETFYKLVNQELDDNPKTEFMAHHESRLQKLNDPSLHAMDSLRTYDYTMVKTRTGRTGTLLHEDNKEGMIMYEDGSAPDVRRKDSYTKKGFE